MFKEIYGICKASRLYHLKPIGIGMPNVESLTGYIKRLAEAHSVSVANLVNKEIIPDMGRDYLKVRNFFGVNAKKINFMQSGIAETFVNVLEEKTCNNSLRHLTMSAWKECFGTENMFKKNYAWCPFCFEESLQLNHPLYEQLIWNIKDVDICKKHNSRLFQECPYCNNLINNSKVSSQMGYCSNCNSWLGLEDYENYRIPIINEEWHNWIYDNVGQLLSAIPTEKGANLIKFNKNIIRLSRTIGLTRLATNINVTHSAIMGWNMGRKPHLTDILGLSFKLECSVYDLLSKDINTLSTSYLNTRTVVKSINHHKKINLNELKKSLDKAVISNNGVSINKLSSQLHIKSEVIKKHFPKETAKLKQMYNELIKVKRQDRLNTIKKAMKLLMSNGIFPSKRAINCEFGKQMIRSEHEVRVWYETLEELGCAKEGYYNLNRRK